MLYQGKCHCGAIGYTYRTELAPEQWPIRSCQCSFCRMHGARTISDPLGRVEFEINEAASLNRYRFGQQSADFLLCGHCGGYLGAVVATQEGSFAVVNVNLLEPYIEALSAPQLMCYDSENIEDRIRRRARRWTPCGDLPVAHPHCRQ